MDRLFTELWSRAARISPIGGDRSRNTKRQILDLLASGFQDDGIARQLGLNVRTVRRYVADVMAEMGATTRFQAGVEATRRSLL